MDLIKAGITRATVDVLIRNAQIICTAQKGKNQKIKKLNLHQRVLAYGALNDDEKAVISYSIGKGGEKILQKLISTDEEFDRLVQKFRRYPKDVLAYLRLNMLSIMTGRNLSPSEKLDRLHRYLRDYFELMCILDREAFPSTGNKVYNYVPTYVPDNLSDMGSDPNIDEKMRSGREKIEVTKMDMFVESEDLFFEIFSKGLVDKKEIVMKVAYWVYKHLPYDYKRRGGFFGAVSVPLVRFKSPDPTAVCRHQALFTQVLNQALGLTSRLLKCNMDGESHVCNLVRLDYQWYLLDVTNPISIKGKAHICLVPVPQRDFDLNKNTYVWKVTHDRGARTYTSRSNMYFRIK
ncbi:hypothetical protein HYW20_02050 [Candidatus Woesearchaeota archaeon]|nr:hypothetical protein [Candidatus Woesearchaeota archaeon]